MSSKRHVRRGPDGRFVAAAAKAARPAKAPASRRDEPGMELKRGRGDRAGGRPQIRKKHKGALTAREIETFLATFAETCNLAHSARTAGRSTDRIFRDLRKRDAAFAAAWDAAFRESYVLLEVEMNRRARKGTVKDVFHNGRKVARVRVYNDALALRLLALHRKSAERMRAADAAPKRDVRTVFAEISARLAEIEAEEAAKKAAGEAGDDGQ
ncbi:MAG TPA: hypothetical protein VF718_02500 [Allosphingosinicella sp.]